VTAVVPSQDATTYLVTSLDSHVRLMDMATGKMLNDFTGHSNESYRCRASFGHGEASVVCGDEKGLVWAWDLLDVSDLGPCLTLANLRFAQGTIMAPNPPPKAHHKVITWTEHHPIEAGELLTASADGTAKVWRAPASQ